MPDLPKSIDVWVCPVCGSTSTIAWDDACFRSHKAAARSQTRYVLAERDRSIQALAWAIDWIERIAEVPVPGTDEQEDWERFAAAQEILRTAATNQKEVGG